MSGLVVFWFFTLLAISPARATSFSIDNSDVWSALNEDGWGLQLVQRADVMFSTMYVYDEQNVPIWYTSTLTQVGTTASGGAIWIGDLYLTRGPWFGLPTFNPAQVSRRRVGQMTYIAQFIDSSALSYTVDGVAVNKQIFRFTLKNDDYTGSYVGAYKVTATQCFNPLDEGTQVILGTFNISQPANSLTIALSGFEGFSCIFPGDYQQFGQFGQSRGSFACTGRQTGNYTILELNVTHSDFRGQILGTNNLGCSLTGNFTALRQ